MVIDTGVADRMDSWLPLQRRLSGSVRVVAFNRAGYGKSEAGPLPRDAGREADELKALLEKAAYFFGGAAS